MNRGKTTALVVICGPPAVGKMTVGQEFARLTGMKLLYNHQIIDLLTPYFEFGSDPFLRLARLIELELMRAAAESGTRLIFTWGWRFGVPGDSEHMRTLTNLFLERDGSAHVVELEAPLEVRLERNRTENRRRNKRTDWATDEAVRALDAEHRFASKGSNPLGLPHLQIETSAMSAAEAALRIREWIGS